MTETGTISLALSATLTLSAITPQCQSLSPPIGKQCGDGRSLSVEVPQEEKEERNQGRLVCGDAYLGINFNYLQCHFLRCVFLQFFGGM